MKIFFFIIQIAFIPALSPACIGIVRKMKAIMQNRHGASIFQPYRDLWKLFHKDEVIPEDSSWVFRYAPYGIFSVTCILGALVPILSTYDFFSGLSDMVVVIYLVALSTFMLALGGIDSGSSFGGFGSSREMTLAALAEGGILFSLFGASLAAGSSNLYQISETVAGLDIVKFAPLIISFLGFFIILLSENSRYPFDNPATHLELTMVHEAMILEYSGKRLALIEWASANKLLIFIALGANTFLSWGIANNFSFFALALSLCFFALKALVMLAAIGLIESTVAKLRFFRLPDLLFSSFILGIISLIIIII